MNRFLLLAFVILASLPAFAQETTAPALTSIEQYLNVRSAGGPSFSPDGKRLAYLTNVTGTSQVWITDLPMGEPKQITDYEDNVSFVRWLPDGKGLIFGKAIGGNENTQFFRISADGGDARELTNNPSVRHNFGDLSEDGTKIYYASNKRNKNFFDIYSMTLADAKEELIYQQDGNNDFAAVDAAGGKLVISRDGIDLSLDNNLYLVDAKTRQEILLTSHTGAAQFGGVHFLPDGKSLVLSSNDKREFLGLANIRLRNGANSGNWSDSNRVMSVVDPTAWDVGGIEVLTNGSNIAYTVNREGFNELYLRGIETGGKPLTTFFGPRSTQVPLPGRGIVGGLTFSKDGGKLAFSFSSSKNNNDIWIYELAAKRMMQVTHSDRAGLNQDTFVEPQLVKFKSFDGREIPAWYYKPTEATLSYLAAIKNQSLPGRSIGGPLSQPGGPKNAAMREVDKIAMVNNPSPKNTGLRVIVSVHGGPEGQERPGFNPLYQYYLSRGYAVLAPNVRGSTGYGKVYTHLDDVRKREDSVKDLAYSVQWLKTAGGADPNRIAVMGGSYGGYMTLAAITLYPDLWAAAVSTVGIANWESFLKNTSGYRRRQREVEYGMLDKDIDFLRSISPLAKADRIRCPLFVIQGKNDPRVPYTEAEQIVNAIRQRAGMVEYRLFDDEGHGVSKLKNRLELYPAVTTFLDNNMN
jgi:dipeptidyl aminopeptidase/acylaminoacyl peptidase